MNASVVQNVNLMPMGMNEMELTFGGDCPTTATVQITKPCVTCTSATIGAGPHNISVTGATIRLSK